MTALHQRNTAKGTDSNALVCLGFCLQKQNVRPQTQRAFHEVIVYLLFLVLVWFLLIQKVGCDNKIGSNAVLDRCGVCNGDGSTCDSTITRNSITNSTVTGSKKDLTPLPTTSLLVTALNSLRNMGYDVDRRGQIANPNNELDENSDEPFYWGVVKSGCSVSCGGG